MDAQQTDAVAARPAGDAVVVHDLLSRLVRASWRMQLSVTEVDDEGDPLTLSEGFALVELNTAGEMSQQDLVVRLGLEKSSVSRLVAGLQRRGLVSRERRPSNQRFVRLLLTSRGQAVAVRVDATHRMRHQRLLGGLSEVQVEALATGLSALVPAMEGDAGPGATA
ncbi:MarR family transcriptional regulator [Kineosporia sp. NBRC 101731]|uniref:MarR family winged helix-turn-helix transcriptional regulator n=1 Tax=Kineosporia sp. NBRC 101731 TaxID=3032199 RepID=UPI0024A27D43|nr:MarR family transcriptional regulator [Kineosporia sp. NBRC 101731]GLY30471.1 hypothetical protein Kisp02_38360 [Kineosporia sp. NBRC 101731]